MNNVLSTKQISSSQPEMLDDSLPTLTEKIFNNIYMYILLNPPTNAWKRAAIIWGI